MDGRVDGGRDKLDNKVIKHEKLGKRFGRMDRKKEAQKMGEMISHDGVIRYR